mgnify:CR=1 FL=1
MDFEMGWAGHPSPYRDEILHVKNKVIGKNYPKYYGSVSQEKGKIYSDYSNYQIEYGDNAKYDI